MNSIERVKKAIKFEGPDRVPIISLSSPHNDFGLMVELPPKEWNAPEGYYPYIMGNVMIKIGMWAPTKEYPAGWMDKPHTAMDEWGTVWGDDGGKYSSLGQAKRPAIQDWKDLETWVAPDPHDQSRYDTVRRIRSLFPDKYILGVNQYFGFTRLMFLRGFENLMFDFYDHPDEVRKLMGKVTEYSLGLMEEYHKLGASAIFAADDLGSQEAPLISPEIFDRFIAEHYTRVTRQAHKLGMDFWLHSCGCINLLIPELIKAGVDVLEFDSPTHTGIEEVAEEFGGKIAFAGCPDIQGAFINGNAAEIEDFVKRMIVNYGSYNGGFVYYEFPDWRLVDIPRENIKAALDAVIKWGAYPLKEEIKKTR